jgi:hypothetical protein
VARVSVALATRKEVAMKVRSGVKGGRLATNHTRRALKVRSGLKGGRLSGNHSRRLV